MKHQPFAGFSRTYVIMILSSLQFPTVNRFESLLVDFEEKFKFYFGILAINFKLLEGDTLARPEGVFLTISTFGFSLMPVWRPLPFLF